MKFSSFLHPIQNINDMALYSTVQYWAELWMMTSIPLIRYPITFENFSIMLIPTWYCTVLIGSITAQHPKGLILYTKRKAPTVLYSIHVLTRIGGDEKLVLHLQYWRVHSSVVLYCTVQYCVQKHYPYSGNTVWYYTVHYSTHSPV